MKRMGMGAWAHSLVVVATTMFIAACSETEGMGPGQGFPRAEPGGGDDTGGQFAINAAAGRVPDLGSCNNIALTEPAKVAAHAYATGDQVYRWTGTGWVFVAPIARLFADESGHGQVGTHYAGPTWESNSGSTVVGTVVDRCPADPASIPWLLLRAVSAEGPGIFKRVTFIHRVNTVGGNAPSAPGTFVGELANVPYSAEYVFYRAP